MILLGIQLGIYFLEEPDGLGVEGSCFSDSALSLPSFQCFLKDDMTCLGVKLSWT